MSEHFLIELPSGLSGILTNIGNENNSSQFKEGDSIVVTVLGYDKQRRIVFKLADH